MLKTLSRLISLPPHIAAKKVVRKLLSITKASVAKRLDRRFSTYEKLYSPPKCLPGFIKPIDPSLLPKKEILQLCSRYLRHEFNLLGSGWVKVDHGIDCLGSEAMNQANQSYSRQVSSLISEEYELIDWHIDFKSGYRWKKTTWSRDIRYGNHLDADVKVPWELARMQHLVMLGWGYALEKRLEYVAEFQNQILDFIASNPPRYGVNWACTMDVGIRIANWLFAYDLYRAYGAQFDASFESAFFQSVYEHGKHIYTHLEWDPYVRANHYLANLAGLLFVSVYLSADHWTDFSLSELQKETQLQFHPDGSNFEGSTSYHRLSSEIVLYATALAQEIGESLSLDLLQKMGDFIRDITKPDGTIVQFGDNDSGRFFKIFPEKNELDHRYLIRCLRSCSGLNSVIQSQLSANEEKGALFAAYPNFGLYLQQKDPWFLALRCGSIGQKGLGGHAHNDQLSFELAVRGISMIVDPGTYVYTPFPEKRRAFRSTASHNTLQVKSLEQHQDEGIFRMIDRAKGKMIRFEKGLFCAEHRGFGPIHRRTLLIGETEIRGIDECEGDSKEIRFHFAPHWVLKTDRFCVCRCLYDSLEIIIETDQGKMEVFEGEYSKAYGEKEKISVLCIHTSAKTTSWKISQASIIADSVSLASCSKKSLVASRIASS